MNYELQELDEIITGLLQPRHFTKQKNKPALIKKYTINICQEVKRICKALAEGIYYCANEIQTTCYVRQHQHSVIQLLDILENYISKNNADGLLAYPTLKPFLDNYKSIVAELNSILIFIRNHYIDHFDYNFKISEYSRNNLFPELHRLIKQITISVLQNKIDFTLKDIVLVPFKYFMDNAHIVNQLDLNYLIFYIKGIKSLLAQKQITDLDIYSLLVRLNFNDPAFTFYYIQKLKEGNTNESINMQAEYYYLQLKIINQVIKKPCVAFDPSLTSIYDQLGTWLAEEIYFLEKKRGIDYTNSNNKDNFSNTEKIKINLSVANLSLAVKLLLDTGIIKAQNTRDILRMVSKTFRTEKAVDISEESLRNKVYNIEPATIAGMKDIIIGLLNEVRKY